MRLDIAESSKKGQGLARVQDHGQGQERVLRRQDVILDASAEKRPKCFTDCARLQFSGSSPAAQCNPVTLLLSSLSSLLILDSEDIVKIDGVCGRAVVD